MNIKTKEIYSEVYQVLNLLGNEYIDRLPKSLFNMLDVKVNIKLIKKYRIKLIKKFNVVFPENAIA